ncbi:MAG: adenylate kinase [Microscillaceae bacterium]|nr:adenylate kinase [Microscillaceae bacterium]
MLNIVLFGPPGAGKGTQSKSIEEHYHLIHISTGDLLFGEVSSGTLLGQQAKEYMLAGRLVPDEIVINMIENKIRANRQAKGFVFDGFPRNLHQAQTLDKLLKQNQIEITVVIAFEVDEAELVRRVLQRGQEKGRFDDQNESIVRSRLITYQNETAPLKEYYTAQNKFITMNGLGSIEQIFQAICTNIDAFCQSQMN